MALTEVEPMLETWPGKCAPPDLLGELGSVAEDPKHDLGEARQALQQAVELDKESPAAAIELGHFLDNVEDDPHAASRVHAQGVATAPIGSSMG